MKCWDIFTFAVMHAVPLSPRDKQSPGLAWQKSTVTSTSPVKPVLAWLQTLLQLAISRIICSSGSAPPPPIQRPHPHRPFCILYPSTPPPLSHLSFLASILQTGACLFLLNQSSSDHCWQNMQMNVDTGGESTVLWIFASILQFRKNAIYSSRICCGQETCIT